MPDNSVRVKYDVHPETFRNDPEINAMLRHHYRELCVDRDGNALAPLWEQYMDLWNKGQLLTLAVLDLPTAKYVGYSVSILGNSMHYGGTVAARNDVIYLHPLWRGEGIDLKTLTEDHARERGAQVYLWHSKPGTTLHAICEADGLPVQDVIHYKRL